MEYTLQGIPNTIVYIDDILVAGSSEDDHLKTLELGSFVQIGRGWPKVKEIQVCFHGAFS